MFNGKKVGRGCIARKPVAAPRITNKLAPLPPAPLPDWRMATPAQSAALRQQLINDGIIRSTVAAHAAA